MSVRKESRFVTLFAATAVDAASLAFALLSAYALRFNFAIPAHHLAAMPRVFCFTVALELALLAAFGCRRAVWRWFSASDLPPLLAWQRLLIVMAVTTAAWVGVTFLTSPTDAAKRAAFQNKIRANGHDIAWGLLAMTVSSVAIYALMFASGYWIYGRTTIAAVMTSIAVISGLALLPILKNLNFGNSQVAHSA